ncbi:hypothetical protein P3T22_002167 [Paraburkholderia sp. GAS348]|jgi:hypothetical protein
MLHSHHKARRLEADVEHIADVLALIVTLAEGGPAPTTVDEMPDQIARLGRAALVGATPQDEQLGPLTALCQVSAQRDIERKDRATDDDQCDEKIKG